MPTFVYKGRSRQGANVAGELEAPDQVSAINELRRQQLFVTSIREKAKEIKIPFGIGGKVKDRDLAILTRQFATMIDAGLPLIQCLTILSTQSDNKILRDVTSRVAHDVEIGTTLAEALRQHPKIFNDLYVNLVEVGEAGGILDEVLRRLSVYIEKAAALKKKVKSALFYPATIISVAIVVVVFLLIFVIPVFAKMFEGFGATLPLPTLIVLKLSDLFRDYFYVFFGLIFAIIFGFRTFYRTEQGKNTIDPVLLKLPIFGILIRKVAVARFTRTLGTLVTSGVPILDGLQITARTAGNKVIEKAVMATRISVSSGKTISEPLKSSNAFPPMVVQMISVGEQTGSLDAMLNKIADFYEEEVDVTVSALTSLLEPLLIVFLGVIIGVLVVAMYLPIFRMITLIK